MRNDDALNDISLDAEPTKEKELLSAQRREILFNFLARVLFSYLPLSVYFIVNIPYFTIPPQDDQPFLKGLFLALSYVFISQTNAINIKQDALGNLLLGVKIFCGILCIAFFATDKFTLGWWLFLPLFIVSLITLYCTNKNIQRIKQ